MLLRLEVGFLFRDVEELHVLGLGLLRLLRTKPTLIVDHVSFFKVVAPPCPILNDFK